MRIITTVLIPALLLVCSAAAWSAELSWKGFTWENQPISGYVSGTVTVDTVSDQLWTTTGPSTLTKNTSFVPYPGWAGEKMSLAKLVWSGAAPPVIRARVYDPGTAACWQVVLKNSLGNIVDYGMRPVFANAKLRGMLYDGTTATWDGNTYIASRYKNGEYWDNYFTKLPDGRIQVNTAWYSAGNGMSASYVWTTPTAFGDIEEIYLSASTSTTIYNTTFKWTDFEIPEPSSFVAVLSGLPIFGVVLRRRK